MPTVIQIDFAVRWAKYQWDNGYSIYVHCAHGHGRSVVILCACLICFQIVGDKTEGLLIIKNRRPKIKLNKLQNQVLDMWIRMWRKGLFLFFLLNCFVI